MHVTPLSCSPVLSQHPLPTWGHAGLARAEQYPGTAQICTGISRAVSEGLHCGEELWAHPSRGGPDASQRTQLQGLLTGMTRHAAGSALMPWHTQLRAQKASSGSSRPKPPRSARDKNDTSQKKCPLPSIPAKSVSLKCKQLPTFQPH